MHLIRTFTHTKFHLNWQMSKKTSHYYVEKLENVVAIWMCSQLLVEDLEKIDVFVTQSLGKQIGIIE